MHTDPPIHSYVNGSLSSYASEHKGDGEAPEHAHPSSGARDEAMGGEREQGREQQEVKGMDRATE